MPDRAPKQQYTRADVRRMLDIPERRLRSWEKQKLIECAEIFSFSDLIAVKTLQKLSESGVRADRIGRAMESLKQKLSGVERPLSELKILWDGNTIAVQISGERMEAISGQMLFNFDTAELTAAVKTLPDRPPAPDGAAAREREAEAWFQKGLALEETGAPPEEAAAAYEKAVELNPTAAGALVNLGTIRFRLHKYKDAERYYQQAIEVDPRYALAHFNLGNLYDEMGRLEEAEKRYAMALQANPSYADAHFNLALLCERRGDLLGAVRHWKAYLRLDRTSSWADIARRQLDKLREASIVR